MSFWSLSSDSTCVNIVWLGFGAQNMRRGVWTQFCSFYLEAHKKKSVLCKKKFKGILHLMLFTLNHRQVWHITSQETEVAGLTTDRHCSMWRTGFVQHFYCMTLAFATCVCDLFTHPKFILSIKTEINFHCLDLQSELVISLLSLPCIWSQQCYGMT